MNIIISREEQTFGPYSSEEVERFLDSGELSPSDLASWEGSEDWVSLDKLLSAVDDTQEEEGFDDEDYDFDHEKMKQWEDVFVDDEEEEIQSEVPHSIKETFPDDDPPPPSSQTVEAVPPSAQQVAPIPSEPPPVEQLSSPSDPSENHGFANPEELPPPPPPPDRSNKVSDESEKRSKPKQKAKSSSKDSSPSKSKRIKGMNSKQTVIVVKDGGVFSKIYTASLIVLILFVLTCLLALGGLIFSYGTVAPILRDMGIPSSLIEKFEPPADSSFLDSFDDDEWETVGSIPEPNSVGRE